jgi:hypothetical protein
LTNAFELAFVDMASKMLWSIMVFICP